MNLPFTKYQGTGNDFVLIDQRTNHHLTRSDRDTIRRMCDRRFGIGADGLMLLQLLEGYDFEMIYFNADGAESSMCGNGGRCLTAFAQHLGLIRDQARFLAIDGPHDSLIRPDGWVELKMKNVPDIEIGEDHFILDTGSPHYVVMVEDVDDINVVENGQAIRYSNRFKREGINVNFVESTPEGLVVATYERGVEDETLSCGTGVTAAAIAFAARQEQIAGSFTVPIISKGGQLEIRLLKNKQGGYEEIWLCGPAKRVFEGNYIS